MMADQDDDIFRLGDDLFTMVPLGDHRVFLLVTRPCGNYEIATARYDEIGDELDRWLRRTYPEDPLRGFNGFISEEWNHETRMIEKRSFLTPGSVAPTLDLSSFIAWRQGCGDRVLTVRTGAGEILYDRKEQVREELTEVIRPW